MSPSCPPNRSCAPAPRSYLRSRPPYKSLCSRPPTRTYPAAHYINPYCAYKTGGRPHPTLTQSLWVVFYTLARRPGCARGLQYTCLMSFAQSVARWHGPKAPPLPSSRETNPTSISPWCGCVRLLVGDFGEISSGGGWLELAERS